MTDNQHGEDRSLEEDQLLQAGKLVLASCAMLYKALAANPAELKLQSVEPCAWPDTSLGLPQPGTIYASVVTKGYRLRIQRGADTFTFHSSVQGPPICADLLPPEAFDADHPLVANAMLDLAEQLQVGFSDITLEHAEIQVPPDPRAGLSKADTHAAGHRQRLHVVLQCGTQTYSYQGPLDQALTRQK